MSNKHSPGKSLADDTIWGVGGENGIAAEIGRTPQQAYYLISTGALGDAVTKLSHKTIVASRSKLRRRLAGSDAPETT
jgi:hypothetical protein